MTTGTGHALGRTRPVRAAELALLDVGIATGGSNTTVQDASKNWVVNQWTGIQAQVKIIKATGLEYSRGITANTANQITFAALPVGVAVVAGDIYSVRLVGAGATTDVTDRWARQLGQIDIARVLGVALAHANPLIVRLSTGAAFEVDLPTLARLYRWGRNVTPAWIHAAEQVAPGAGAILVTRAVTAGMVGYIYGFFISTQEANNFLVNWTSGGAPYSKRLVFGAGGSMEVVDSIAFNEGLPADAATNVTITNVTAGGALIVYQAGLLYAEI